MGDTRGVKDWQNLDTLGDVKRLLRWAVLSMRNQTLDRQDAAVLTQIANVLFRAIEGHDLEAHDEWLTRPQREQAYWQRCQELTANLAKGSEIFEFEPAPGDPGFKYEEAR